MLFAFSAWRNPTIARRLYMTVFNVACCFPLRRKTRSCGRHSTVCWQAQLLCCLVKYGWPPLRNEKDKPLFQHAFVVVCETLVSTKNLAAACLFYKQCCRLTKVKLCKTHTFFLFEGVRSNRLSSSWVILLFWFHCVFKHLLFFLNQGDHNTLYVKWLKEIWILCCGDILVSRVCRAVAKWSGIFRTHPATRPPENSP